MATWLRQSTAVEVAIGPFLDETTAKDAESALTITQPDIRLKKNGGAWAQKNAAQTLTHEESGWYEISLDSTDTNTLGVLIVAVHESGALPVWREFLVVTANIYDTFFSTDLLQVDLTQLLGSAVATPTVAGVLEADVTHWLGSTAATPTVAGVPEVDVTHYLGAAAPALVSGRYSANVGSISASAITATSIAADAITFSEIADGAITAAKFGPDAINTDVFSAGVVAEIQTGLATSTALSTALTDLDNIQTRIPTALVGGRIDASVGAVAANAVTATAIAADAITAAKVAAGTIDAATLAADTNTYATRSWLSRQGATADKYIVQWYRNGQLVTSGITLPLIRVFDDDGTDLIAETAMTEIGTEQCFKFVEATNKLTAGEIYMLVAKATIDGAVRTDRQPVMRDSA